MIAYKIIVLSYFTECPNGHTYMIGDVSTQTMSKKGPMIIDKLWFVFITQRLSTNHFTSTSSTSTVKITQIVELLHVIFILSYYFNHQSLDC